MSDRWTSAGTVIALVVAAGLAARGESPAAFGERCIPAGCVAPRSNIPDILARRVLPAGRLARLGATLDLHHGLPAAGAGDDKRPTLGLRATPVVAFTPAEILFVGELKGGDNDYEEFYCASVEWDWDDDTRSTTTEDCEPYEAGKSEIRRRFTMRHKFDHSGEYEIRLYLKNKDKILTTARTRVEVRGGLPRF